MGFDHPEQVGFDEKASGGNPGVLFGIDGGVLAQQGMMYLRSPNAGVNSLFIRFSVNPATNTALRKITFTITNQQGQFERLTRDVSVDGPITMPLPVSDVYPVYQLSWEFNYSACTSPSSCSAGVLQEVSFR